MSTGFTTFVVDDPHDVPIVAWNRLPLIEKSRVKEREVWSRTYEPADLGRFRAEPESYRSIFSIGHCGALRLSRIADARGRRGSHRISKFDCAFFAAWTAAHLFGAVRTAAGTPGNVRRAEEFIRASAEDVVTIENVARAAGSSVRALRLAFRRYRNMTPMEALRRVRPERARAEILIADGSQSVIEIAMKFGFSHPGRFATQYMRAFGEYPSEVLRRRLRSI